MKFSLTRPVKIVMPEPGEPEGISPRTFTVCCTR